MRSYKLTLRGKTVIFILSVSLLLMGLSSFAALNLGTGGPLHTPPPITPTDGPDMRDTTPEPDINLLDVSPTPAPTPPATPDPTPTPTPDPTPTPADDGSIPVPTPTPAPKPKPQGGALSAQGDRLSFVFFPEQDVIDADTGELLDVFIDAGDGFDDFYIVVETPLISDRDGRLLMNALKTALDTRGAPDWQLEHISRDTPRSDGVDVKMYYMQRIK